jgi:hypothetical protein
MNDEWGNDEWGNPCNLPAGRLVGGISCNSW